MPCVRVCVCVCTCVRVCVVDAGGGIGGEECTDKWTVMGEVRFLQAIQ